MTIDRISPSLPSSPFQPELELGLKPVWPDRQRAFGRVLRQARLHAGLSRSDFARQAGMDVMNLRRCEWGLQLPAIEALPRVELLAVWLQAPTLMEAFCTSHAEMSRQDRNAAMLAGLPELLPLTNELSPAPCIRP